MMPNESMERVGPGVDAASQDDAAWFEANPGRKLRLRNRIAGEYEAHQIELPPPGLTARTLVVQAQPGVRMRQPVAVFADVRNDEVTDAQLFTFFEETANLEMRQLLAKLRKVKLSGEPKRR